MKYLPALSMMLYSIYAFFAVSLTFAYDLLWLDTFDATISNIDYFFKLGAAWLIVVFWTYLLYAISLKAKK